MPYTEEEKPAKKHYNRFIKRTNSVWIFDKNEPVCNISASVLQSVEQKTTFKPWYPTELAISYGLKSKLIELKPDGKEFTVMLTDKGMNDLIKKQKSTCVFTGRKVR